MTERLSEAQDSAQRQRVQAAGFDAIGSRYDEVFPHKDGQLSAVEQLIIHLPGGHVYSMSGVALVFRQHSSSSMPVVW